MMHKMTVENTVNLASSSVDYLFYLSAEPADSIFCNLNSTVNNEPILAFLLKLKDIKVSKSFFA